jgi:hypothetical protein
MTTNTSSTSSPSVTSPEALATPAVATPPTTTAPSGNARVAMTAFTKANPAALIVASQNVLTGMTGNASYPAPTPSLANLTTARSAYVTAVTAAKDSKIQLVVRNQLHQALVAILRDLALYVQVTSSGDLATLMSSGFTAQRTRQPAGPLPPPANLRLKKGPVSGQFAARCKRLPHARAYEWRFANATTPTVWTDLESTFAASTLVEGLAPGTQYIVQVRSLGTAGPSDWSSSASLMAT